MTEKLRILDACSGSGSWLENWRDSHSYDIELHAVDIVKRPHITHVMDILDFTPEKPYHIVYASPPCNDFSQIRRLSKTPVTEEDLEQSKKIAAKCFELGKAAVLAYVIENPATGMLPKLYPDYQVVDYSEYGYPLRKRTAIWSNLTFHFKTKEEIKYNDSNLPSSDEKWRIPKKLRDYIKWVIIKKYMQELKAFHLPKVKEKYESRNKNNKSKP